MVFSNIRVLKEPCGLKSAYNGRPRMISSSEFTVIKLYRDCLRLANYISTKGGNRAVLIRQVTEAFRKNQNETDPEKIEEQKQAAIRGLSNYMFFEAQRMAKEEAQQGNDKFDG